MEIKHKRPLLWKTLNSTAQLAGWKMSIIGKWTRWENDISSFLIGQLTCFIAAVVSTFSIAKYQSVLPVHGMTCSIIDTSPTLLSMVSSKYFCSLHNEQVFTILFIINGSLLNGPSSIFKYAKMQKQTFVLPVLGHSCCIAPHPIHLHPHPIHLHPHPIHLHPHPIHLHCQWLMEIYFYDQHVVKQGTRHITGWRRVDGL